MKSIYTIDMGQLYGQALHKIKGGSLEKFFVSCAEAWECGYYKDGVDVKYTTHCPVHLRAIYSIPGVNLRASHAQINFTACFRNVHS